MMPPAGSRFGGQVSDHFSGVADDYAAYRPEYPAALIDLLGDLAPECDLAWDAGCGSGQLSVALARRFDRVIATDVSAEQLARAARHPRVDYRRAGAEASGIPPRTVDLAVAAQAVHWFDLPAYYAEVRRVARPGLLIALVTYGLLRVGPDVDRVVDRFYAEVLGPYWPPERRHVESGYRALAFPFLELPAPPLDMRAQWTLPHVLGFIGTWSALRGLERAGRSAVLDEFRRALGRVWGAPDVRRPVRWDLALRLGRIPGRPAGNLFRRRLLP
jgi:SAM-dependent methyltransferase